MSLLTTHVLDAVLGRPAVGVIVTLTDSAGGLVASGVTDDDGRVSPLGPDILPAGTYRLTFATGAYFAATGTSTFYPEVVITFTTERAGGHCHVPLLLSPFAYSTYRGS